MPKKLDNKTIIERSKKVHGDKYDYSLVKYVNSKTKVKIICPNHGMFEQIPELHYKGNGCKKCGTERNAKRRRKTLDTFIADAIKIHGDKYDYSKVKYINADTKVIITCKKHGDFKQSPYCHINKKHGCIKCQYEKLHNLHKKDKDEFISQAKKIHRDMYDYSEVTYINGKTKVKIMCGKHGVFHQTPSSHIRGRGCK